MEYPFDFQIGKDDWEKRIRNLTRKLDANYWSGFRPASIGDIQFIEQYTGRTLPSDFKEFLLTFGAGEFVSPFGGGLFAPTDIVAACHMHLSMMLGSLGSNPPWATESEQLQFYVTRGKFNPSPHKYTEQALTLGDVNLLDLLQVGTDGGCGYRQVYVGEHPGSFGYCLLTSGGGIEDRAASFSEGLRNILTEHWNWDEVADDS